MRTWAAAELFCSTGDPEVHNQFRALYNAGGYTDAHWSYGQYLPSMMQSYALTKCKDADHEIQSAMRDRLLKIANDILKKTDEPAYRVGLGAKNSGIGWGNLNGGGRYAVPLLIAHYMTGDQRYLDAASLNADFQLGCNPLSKTFITGMGARPPLHPQIAAYLYTGPDKTGTTVKGITIYGLASRDLDWYPRDTAAVAALARPGQRRRGNQQ